MISHEQKLKEYERKRKHRIMNAQDAPTPAQLERIYELLGDPAIPEEWINGLGSEKVKNLLQSKRGAGVLIAMLKKKACRT